MYSMVMLDITREVSVNKALSLKGRTQAWLGTSGHTWTLLLPFGLYWYWETLLFWTIGLNLLKARNNKLDKGLI